jgi:hypothetical protein
MNKYSPPGTRQYVEHYLSDSYSAIGGNYYSSSVALGIKKTYNIILNNVYLSKLKRNGAKLSSECHAY